MFLSWDEAFFFLVTVGVTRARDASASCLQAFGFFWLSGVRWLLSSLTTTTTMMLMPSEEMSLVSHFDYGRIVI
jgi:hypothetical protein